MGPALIVNVARSYEGFEERGEIGAIGARGVPFTTVALNRICVLFLSVLYLKLATGLNVPGLLHKRGSIFVAILQLICALLSSGRSLVHRRFPDVVGDVV